MAPDSRALKAIDGALRFWWIIPAALAAWALLSFGQRVLDWIDGPSGREVAAEVRANNADSERRTAAAETRAAQDVVAIVEQHHDRRAHVRAEVERTREVISAAPDLDARYDAYLALSSRLRDESRAAAAAAVRDYRAGLPADAAATAGAAEPR